MVIMRLKNLARLGKLCILSVFYCLCYVTDISKNMLEDQVAEDRDPDLNEEEDIRMEDSREEHWRDVSEDDEDNNKIHALKWDIYTR